MNRQMLSSTPSRISSGTQGSLLLVLVLLINACSSDTSGPLKHLRWSETIETVAGQQVAIERQLAFGISAPIGDPVGMIIPESTIITIEKAGTKLPSIDVGPLTPVLLAQDESTNEMILVAGTNNCRFWLRNGEPAPPYWTFRLRGDEWFRTELPQALVGRSSNILVDVRPQDRGQLDSTEVTERKATQASTTSISKSLLSVLSVDPQRENCGHATGGDGELDLKRFRRL